MQRKRASFSRDAVNGYPAAMGMGNVLDDGKTESRTAKFTASGLVDPVESFKKTGQMFLWNSAAMILNTDLQLFIL